MTMTRLSIAILLLLPAAGRGQTFNDFLGRVLSAPEPERAAIVDSFMATVPAFPFVEFDSLCHFIYRGAAATVTVPGDANGWAIASFPMTRLTATDFWYHTKSFEPDARLDYKFVLNGSTWILDPRNPHQVSGGFGPNSELRMPAYVPAPEIVYRPDIPHGTLRDTVFTSTNLGNSRTVRIYTPPGYSSSTDSFPVVLVHDGLEYVTLAQMNNVLDYLAWEGRIQPTMAVFVPPVNRTAEYAGSQMTQFTAFIVDELMPVIDAQYRTMRNPAFRAVLGASNGGNISLWIGYTHPDVFGAIAAQSSNIISSISSGFQGSPRLDLRLYLDLGTYDIAQLIPLVRNFIPILQSKGYPYRYVEYHEGHSWGNWRAHVDNALEMFFPGPALAVRQDEGIPSSLTVSQNYPNPFNPTTTFEFTIADRQQTVVKVYDLLGREVETLVNEVKEPGTHVVRWDAGGRASGIYWYRCSAGTMTVARKLVLLR